jgi:hypothetical protein
MIDAAIADDEAIKTNEPAMEKLMQHTTLFERLKSYQLKEHLLDQDAQLLNALARWLKPSATGLCAGDVRNAVYDFIEKLDIDMERDLTSNDLGKVLMALRKHPLETQTNQRRITVSAFARVVVVVRELTSKLGWRAPCARACVSLSTAPSTPRVAPSASGYPPFRAV